LEFTMTGKPVIASNWSGHKDFLPVDKSIMVGGSLTDVHESTFDNFIIKGSKWFTANYNEFSSILKLVKDDYDSFTNRSELLRMENNEKFSLDKMKDKLQGYLEPFSSKPKETKLTLPKLNKIK
jgi:hypothetical protein